MRDQLVEVGDVSASGELELDPALPREPQLEFRIDDVVVGGRTVHAEPLAEEQAIDELNIAYAALGDVLLVRVQPYREAAPRFQAPGVSSSRM